MFTAHSIIQDEIWWTKRSCKSVKYRLFTLFFSLIAMTTIGAEIFLLSSNYILKSVFWLIVLSMDYNVIIRIYALLFLYEKVEMWDRLKGENN